MIRSSRLYDDTDSLGRYSLVVTNTTAYRLREQRPSGGTGGWKCSYPNASTSGGFASVKGGERDRGGRHRPGGLQRVDLLQHGDREDLRAGLGPPAVGR